MKTRELRFSFVVGSYDTALRLFRDVFGLEVIDQFEPGRGTILRVPSATLELLDEEHGAFVDETEAGRKLEDGPRIAVRIDDLEEADAAVTRAGLHPVAGPVRTPWGDRNRRYRLSPDLQLTLFQPSA